MTLIEITEETVHLIYSVWAHDLSLSTGFHKLTVERVSLHLICLRTVLKYVVVQSVRQVGVSADCQLALVLFMAELYRNLD